jgi:hypothetical protein
MYSRLAIELLRTSEVPGGVRDYGVARAGHRQLYSRMSGTEIKGCLWPASDGAIRRTPLQYSRVVLMPGCGTG